MTRPPVPESADVVIIGAGMGGLTAAALLSKAGMKVCVLEMDARPGGYLAGYHRKKYTFDTAIHWLNQCGPGGTVRRVLDFVGSGSPDAPPLQKIRRYKGESFDYLLTDDPEQFHQELIRDHPDQAKGLSKFFAASRKIGDAFEKMSRNTRAMETMSAAEKARFGMGMASVGLIFGRYVGAHTEAGVDRHFKAPILKKVYCSEERLLSCLTPVGWAYHGDYQAPPAGGSLEFPRWLANATRSFGSHVVYKARVDRIVLDGKAVAGVEAVVGIRDPQRHAIKCKYVLAACDLEAVYERMLPVGTIDQGLLDKLHEADLYDSCVTINLGLDIDPRELGFDEELVMLTRDDVSRADHNCGDPHKSAINILAPSVRDPTLCPAGHGTMTLLCTANIAYGDKWKTGPDYERGPEYEAFKKAYADIILDRLEARYRIDLRKHITVCDVATPVTHRRYTGNRDGSIMAARPTKENIRSRIAHYLTPVEGLMLAGHWAEYGGGVPIAVRAGSNSALLVLKREKPAAFKILRDVMDTKRAPSDVDPQFFQELVPA